MADNGKKVEVRYGAFACTVEGYDDPVAQVREILTLMQRMISETPALSEQAADFDADKVRSALHEDETKDDTSPGIVVIRAPDAGSSEVKPSAEDAVAFSAADAPDPTPPEAKYDQDPSGLGTAAFASVAAAAAAGSAILVDDDDDHAPADETQLDAATDARSPREDSLDAALGNARQDGHDYVDDAEDATLDDARTAPVAEPIDADLARDDPTVPDPELASPDALRDLGLSDIDAPVYTAVGAPPPQSQPNPGAAAIEEDDDFDAFNLFADPDDVDPDASEPDSLEPAAAEPVSAPEIEPGDVPPRTFVDTEPTLPEPDSRAMTSSSDLFAPSETPVEDADTVPGDIEPELGDLADEDATGLGDAQMDMTMRSTGSLGATSAFADLQSPNLPGSDPEPEGQATPADDAPPEVNDPVDLDSAGADVQVENTAATGKAAADGALEDDAFNLFGDPDAEPDPTPLAASETATDTPQPMQDDVAEPIADDDPLTDPPMGLLERLRQSATASAAPEPSYGDPDPEPTVAQPPPHHVSVQVEQGDDIPADDGDAPANPDEERVAEVLAPAEAEVSAVDPYVTGQDSAANADEDDDEDTDDDKPKRSGLTGFRSLLQRVHGRSMIGAPGEPGEEDEALQAKAASALAEQVKGLAPEALIDLSGAEGVAEKLSASAAWLTLVQGKSRFTRREVMAVFDNLPGDHPRTLEARIKGFGKLVRSGTLILIDDGVFAMAQSEREKFQAMLPS